MTDRDSPRTDPTRDDTTPDTAAPDDTAGGAGDDQDEELTPAFELDLDPEDQGRAGAAGEESG